MTLEGHRQENMSYNFSNEHFTVIFFSMRSTKGCYIVIYSIFSCNVNLIKKKQNKLKTLKRKEKKPSPALGGKKISIQVLQESK